MSADLPSLLVSLVTDPVYGVPLTLWAVTGVVWLIWGHGTFPPMLLPYRAQRLRASDPVSSMYWALRERRYSEAILFAYQRLAAAFHLRYRVAITAIPWRRKHRARIGLGDPRPYRRILLRMVKALDIAYRLERPPTGASWAVLRRGARQRALAIRMTEILGELDRMIPELEGRT